MTRLELDRICKVVDANRANWPARAVEILGELLAALDERISPQDGPTICRECRHYGHGEDALCHSSARMAKTYSLNLVTGHPINGHYPRCVDVNDGACVYFAR